MLLQARRETLVQLSGQVANRATEVAEQAHSLSDVVKEGDDAELVVNSTTTKLLWARDALDNIMNYLADEPR